MTVYRGVLILGDWIEVIYCIQRSHFRGLELTVYRGVLISGSWNRGVPQVSSFQGTGVDCIQRCPHFRVTGIEVFHCIQRSHFRVTGIEVFHCIQRSHFRVTGIEVFHCIQRSHFRVTGIEVFHCIQRSHFRVSGIEVFHCIQRSHFRGLELTVLISGCWNKGVDCVQGVLGFGTAIIVSWLWRPHKKIY